MTAQAQNEFVVVGAGAAGLMVARELARAGKRVILLEARNRAGGRIEILPEAEFGYAAEAGAEFVHGAAHHTHDIMREAGLSLTLLDGTGWQAENGVLSPNDRATPNADEFRRALIALRQDMPVAEFLARHFSDPRYADLRFSITRMVEGYDAADPSRASTFALREEWMGRGLGQQGRIAEGYGKLIAFLLDDRRRLGVAVHFNAVVTSIDTAPGKVTVRCRDGRFFAADAAILTVPLPLLGSIALPPEAQDIAAAAIADIGFGNVVKILLRFSQNWWADRTSPDLSFLFSRAAVPTWWTQHPDQHPVLTGWLAGPRANSVATLSSDEVIERALTSLAQNFAVAPDWLKGQLVAARAIDWGSDPFARGAYSYATPSTHQVLARVDRAHANVWFSGEAFYAGPEMGTVEAAFASGWRVVQAILRGGA
ncbi:MAG TPA: NAD(P)/FAD-dependent oxidoreductase [Stellaceae bacterium]|nr:NAD(P)/FAD-dependent oxidoreductase [Stellaceae bacterium]